MADYLHELEFGIFPTPDASRLPQLLESVAVAEVEGFDLVTIQDHPYQQQYVDTWTLLAALGARTSTIKLSPNVACLPLRPPVVLAKSAATLDLLTSGRVELGLGAGAFWDAIVAAGGERRSPGEAVDALAEAIDLIRLVWAGGTVRFDGKHYQARGFKAGPVPAHPIPIWIGAYKPRMLRLTGRAADAWVPSMGYADPPALPELSTRLDEAAVAAGRAPEQIKRIYNVNGRFGAGSGFLQGNPRDWAEQLAELTLTVGMSTYVVSGDDLDFVRRFAAEVAPLTRELVTAERARAAAAPTSAADDSAAERVAAGTATGGRPNPSATDRRHTDTVAPQSHSGLTVQATPDDGTRLTGELDWDEAARPTHDEPAGVTYQPQLEQAAQHLVDVHDHLRAELTQLRDVLSQVRQGQLSVGAARNVINEMTMRQSNWTLGAYCESYCRVVTGHHTLEDRSIFPHLRRTEPGLGAVLDRLESEHHIIHDVLDEFDRALVELVGGETPGAAGRERLAAVQHAVDLLTDTLLSHLAYEERELIGPLARHGFG